MKFVPTLIATLAVASAASGAVSPATETWTQRQGFVIGPTLPWEADVVQEPTVLVVNGKLHLFYSGGFNTCLMGHATSSDGVRWTKEPKPVLGGGAGGERWNACHSNVYYDRGRFHALYSADAGPGKGGYDLFHATSQDGSKWTRQPKPILTTQGWEGPFANTFVRREPNRIVMLYECLSGDYWEMGLATGPDLQHLKRARVGRLKTLQRSGMYGGPWLEKHGRSYRLYFHASRTPAGNLPTDIYTATSRNLTSWTVQDVPLVARSQPWQVDQVADPSIVRWKGRTLMYFDGFDNNWPGHARIGFAVLRARP